MGAAGSPHANFQRAVQRGNVTLALAAARDIGRPLALGDALALTLLFARKRPEWYERAAVRWLGRFAVEARDVTLADLHVALGALTGIGEENADLAADTLLELARRYRVPVMRASH